jgi:small-conductance mechanosensitive channel
MDEINISEHIVIELLPIIHVFLVGILALMIKDFLSSVAKGMRFCLSRTFGEGDKVKVDGEDAIIVKIGLTQTTFSIIKSNGDYVWRFVPNEMISELQLEKVIFHKEQENSDITEVR